MVKGKVTEAVRFFEKCLKEKGLKVSKIILFGSQVKGKTKFVLIPAGEFDMGSPPNEANRAKNEGPVHHVKIPEAFYMGRYEVTQKQWREVMGNNPSTFKGSSRVFRGGSWIGNAGSCRNANREDNDQGNRGSNLGFRLVRDV